MMRLSAFTFVVALTVVLGSAEGSSLKVSPIKVFLPSDGKSEVVRLKNSGDEPLLVQVHAVEWVRVEELDQAKHADEILAVPPIFEIAPRDEQVIRIAHRDPKGAGIEKAYRLLITEVLDEADHGGVVFTVRLNMPLFVTPENARPEPIWTLEHADSGEAELILTNIGNAHLMVESLELRERGQTKPIFETDRYVHVLAAKKQSWSLGYSLSTLPQSLEVYAKTNQGLIETLAAKIHDG